MSPLNVLLQQSLSWAAVIVGAIIESRADDVVSCIDDLGKVAWAFCHGVGSLSKSAGRRKVPSLTVRNISAEPCELFSVCLIDSRVFMERPAIGGEHAAALFGLSHSFVCSFDWYNQRSIWASSVLRI